MDPYVLIQYKGQERKSSVAREQGSSPVWNERFTFRAEYPGSGEQYKVTLKIMDKDTFTADDYIGEATIYVKDLLALGVENGTAQLHPLILNFHKRSVDNVLPKKASIPLHNYINYGVY
ncbi:elicitor-responsive protein 1 [Prunus avium]|uniref:Elicitor-responsive protein 1 n=1 Tax=Prunus avium TaxID=42229 RepID=A0A6P5SHL2_PRUAV|nr:elicitor-responsive protein 1 [Prunus avium]